MEPEVRERFERSEALLHAMVERDHQIEIRFNRRMEAAMKCMDRADERMDRLEERMEKFDRQLQATRKLVEAGMKLLLRLEQRNKAEHEKLRESIHELNKSQKAFLDSLRKGGNGFRRPS